MRVVAAITQTLSVRAEIDDDTLEEMILAAIAKQSNVSIVGLRANGRLSFELSDAGTPEQPRWSARFVAEIPLPVGEGR